MEIRVSKIVNGYTVYDSDSMKELFFNTKEKAIEYAEKILIEWK